MPHLSNAGVHKLLADDIVFSALKSSAAMGYLAPEYTTTGRFTEKSDIYAFGVLTLQILTGTTKKIFVNCLCYFAICK
jgi:serine/threonine protein kinase